MQETIEKDAITSATIATIEQFNEVFNRHDVDGVMNLMTDDVVFEGTYPPPDGITYSGQAAVRAFWEKFFRSKSIFETEEMFATGDRCVVLWVSRWTNKDGTPGHVRGVDIFTVRDGKVARKLSYVKG